MFILLAFAAKRNDMTYCSIVCMQSLYVYANKEIIGKEDVFKMNNIPQVLLIENVNEFHFNRVKVLFYILINIHLE
jgi:hypothetical protein